MKPEELSTFKASVENNLGYNIENTPNYQHTISNAVAGLHDDGKTGGILNSWRQYAKSGDIIFDVAGGLGGGIALRASSKVVGKVSSKLKVNKISESIANGHAWVRHKKQFPEFSNSKELQQHVAKIIKKPSDFKTLQNGRKAYWDDKSKTMVITNPKDLDGGTIFKPSSGKKYFDKQL